MNELPFGSVSSGWPAIPLTAWPPMSLPVQGRGAGGFASPGQPMQAAQNVMGGFRPTQPFNAAAPDPYAQSGAPTWLAPINVSPFALAGGYPAVAPPLPFAATIPMLLTSVAMRRGQPAGPTNDQEVEDFIYDVLELIPGTNEVEIRSENAKVTLTGSVPHRRLKHDVGEIVWSIPNLADVQNNVVITTRRRARAGGKEHEQSGAQGRKQP